MKLRSLLAGAPALALLCAPALGQVNQGTSPLSVAKGGTGAASLTANQLLFGNGTSPISPSPFLIQGTTPFGGGVLTGLTVASTPAFNARNGTTIANGVGPNGSGATIIMWAQNGTFLAPTPIVTQQELGSVSVLGWNGSAFAPASNNTGIIFTSTEAWTPSANGSAVVFQATPTGGVFANNEVSIANGVMVLGSNTTLGNGLGWGTLNAANGLFDNLNRVVSASNPNITSASANAFTVGATGATNPAFRVDASTGTGTGLSVTSQAAGGGVGVAVVSSGTNEGVAINGKGTGTITLANVSTGAVNVASSLKVTSSSASALAAGLNGTVNPAFLVDASAALQATGVQISGAAAGSGAGIAAISSGTNEALAINAKGSSQIVLGNVSTGTVNVSRALTYGGVLLSNAVTGTGNMVLSDTPTLTGVPLAPTPAAGANTAQIATAAAIVAERAATKTLTNTTLNSTGTGNVLQVSGVTVSAGQYPGETSTGSATAGNVGEYVESVIVSGSAVSLVSSAPKTVTSITLTAGDWDADLVTQFFPANTTQFTQLACSLSLVTNTNDTTPGRFFQVPQNSITSNGSSSYSCALPNYRFSLSGTTTIFMVATSTFSVSTMTGFGIIRARRVR